MRYCYCLFLSLKHGERWRFRHPDFRRYVIHDTIQTIYRKIIKIMKMNPDIKVKKGKAQK